MTTMPFPLQWPSALARTPAEHRRRSSFGTDHSGDVSIAAARVFVLAELDRMGAAGAVVTSNVPTRRDEVGCVPENDPGASVWFSLDGEQRCIACDRWTSIAENVRAIGLTIEAMRGLSRWGAADAVGQAMQGFIALPPGDSQEQAVVTQPVRPVPSPAPARLDWRTLLRVQPGDDLEAVRTNYRRLIRIVHPDVGGRSGHAATLNLALQEAEGHLK